MSAQEKLKGGDVSGWVAALANDVKKAPANAQARMAFGQALVIAGDLERADNQFDIVIGQDPTWAPRTALLRQLVRALKSRAEFFEAGRPPEVLKDPSPYLAALLKANVVLRQSGAQEARAAFEEAEALRAPRAGSFDETAFEDFRDLDDRTGGVLETLTSTGKYFWLELSHVRSIVFRDPGNLLDTILWPAEVDIEDGPSGVVYVPAIYWAAPDAMTADMRLGRMTDWGEDDDAVALGRGRRCFLVGEEDEPLGRAASISFAAR